MKAVSKVVRQSGAVLVAGFVVVSSFRLSADTPTAAEMAERFKNRRSLEPSVVRQRVRDGLGRELTPREERRLDRSLARRRGLAGFVPTGVAGFPDPAVDAPSLTPQNPLLDPLGIFDDETGEEPPVGEVVRIDFADFDGDGDLDAFVGDKYGYVRYFENVGGDTDPVYEERTGMDSPTGSLDLSPNGDGGAPNLFAAPVLVDIDDDGDLDLFVGQGDEDGPSAYPVQVLFFENVDGTLVRNDADNPIPDLPTLGTAPAPVFVDVDQDGDLDAFVGALKASLGNPEAPLQPSNIVYLENTGDDMNPVFVDQTDVVGEDPFAEVVYSTKALFVDFGDLDGDGDDDAVLVDGDRTRFFENQTMLPGAPVFVERLGDDNPLFGSTCFGSGPELVDIDGDDDLDLYLGSGYTDAGVGFPLYLENTGTPEAPAFLTVGDRIELVDVDGDGDLDALASFYDSGETNELSVELFENQGDASEPVWVRQTGADNPFDTFNTAYAETGASDFLRSLAPTVGLLDDGDSLLDAFVGLPGGGLEYLEDDGTGQLDPTAVYGDGSLEAYDFGYDADPQLVDVDGDGELDLVVGYNRYDDMESTYSSYVAFFLNETGAGGIDATPDLVLDVTDLVLRPAPTAVDVDGDGDTDLFLGGYTYDAGSSLVFLENTSATPGGLTFDPAAAQYLPVLTELASSPAFGDLNGDGALDLALGSDCGAPEFFLSAIPAVEVTKAVTGGDLLPGGTVEYTITIENVGTATIEDLSGAELSDVLPAELALTGAMVTSGPGAVTVDTGANTVTYDGTIGVGEMVTITVSADVADGIDGQLVSNQAFANFDTDADMTADTQEPSDDPATADDDDPTTFMVGVVPRIEVTKTITGGDLEEGGTVEYTIRIDNVGSGEQPDDPANPELTDTLPAGLTLVAATVTSGPGAATADPGTNTVRYDGAIPAGETVTIVIEATIDPGTAGDVVTNQAVAFFDADADGTNDTEEPSDDPATADVDDGTAFVVERGFDLLEIPTLSEWGAILFGGLLSLAGLLGIRRMG